MSEELSELDHELLGDNDACKKNDKITQSKASPNFDAPAELNGIVSNMESSEELVETSSENVSIYRLVQIPATLYETTLWYLVD